MRYFCALTFASLLSAAPGVCADGPFVTDLGLLPGDFLIAPATDSQQDVSAARGGAVTLVAWSDYRARSASSQAVQSDGDIFGIRLDASGAPIDPAPFLIAGGMGLQRVPVVAWNGQAWLVAYTSQDPVGGYYEDRLRAVRVSASGQVLDTTPILFPTSALAPSSIGLNISGLAGQWLVTRCVYHADGYGTFLAGQRIDGAGQLIDANPVMLIDWVYGSTRTLVSGNEYLVAGQDWYDSSLAKARRITSSLQPIAAPFTVPSLNIATSGTEYYVAWIANYTDLVGSRVTQSGTLLTPSGTMLVPNFYGDLTMAHDGANWWIAWSLSSTAKTMRISPAGAVLDPGGVLLPIIVTGNVTSLYSPQLIARTGGGVMFMWSDLRAANGYDSNAFVLPVSGANSPGNERCVSLSSKNQRASDLAAGPSGRCAVAFVSEAAYDDRVLVHLLTPGGVPVSAEPIEVYRGVGVGRAAIAWNGAVYMVAWDATDAATNATTIKVRRMTGVGAFIDAAPIDVMPGFNPDIDALGDDFLVACARYATYPQFIDLWARRIDGPTGAFIDPGPVGLAGGYYTGYTRVRNDGTNWWVASSTMWTHDSSQGDAVYALVPPTGTPSPVRNPTPFSGGSGDLDVAYSGGKYLFVWRNNSLSNANNYIAGRIMNPDGTFPGGAFVIAEATGRQLRPTVGWDGLSFVVLWEDQRNQGSFFDARTDIFAARVSESGMVLDSAGIPVVRGIEGDAGPALLCSPTKTLVSSTRFTLGPSLDSYRIGLSTLAAPPPPCPGDFTGDRAVTTQDLAVLLGSFGLVVTPNTAGDMDGNGMVNTADLLALLGSFGLAC